jgi:hypothetical protein
MEVTIDDMHDSKVLQGLMIDTSRCRCIAEHIWMEHMIH